MGIKVTYFVIFRSFWFLFPIFCFILFLFVCFLGCNIILIFWVRFWSFFMFSYYNKSRSRRHNNFFFKKNSCYNNNKRCRIFWGLFSMFSHCKRDTRCKNLFWFLHCLLLQQRNTKCNKKQLGLNVVCFLVAIGLGGATNFLGVFLLCFLAITRVGDEGKKIMCLSIVVKKLIIFLYANVKFVTTWLLGINIIYTKLGKEGQKEL